MAGTVHVKGLAELQAFLDQVPAKIERNIMRGALRAGMNVVKPVAQGNVHSVSGALAKGLKIRTRAKGGTVTASLKATGPHAWLAHIIEFTGARAHLIVAEHGKALRLFGGKVVWSVRHPGFKPRPFMRPALDAESNRAVVASGEYMKKRLATKQGLDTSDVLIEGNE